MSLTQLVEELFLSAAPELREVAIHHLDGADHPDSGGPAVDPSSLGAGSGAVPTDDADSDVASVGSGDGDDLDELHADSEMPSSPLVDIHMLCKVKRVVDLCDHWRDVYAARKAAAAEAAAMAEVREREAAAAEAGAADDSTKRGKESNRRSRKSSGVPEGVPDPSALPKLLASMLRSSQVLQVAPDGSACQLLPDDLRTHFIVAVLRRAMPVARAMRGSGFDGEQAAATAVPLHELAAREDVRAVVRSPRLLLRAASGSPALVVYAGSGPPAATTGGNPAAAAAPDGAADGAAAAAAAAGGRDPSVHGAWMVRVASRQEHIRQQIESWLSPQHFHQDGFWPQVGATSNSAHVVPVAVACVVPPLSTYSVTPLEAQGALKKSESIEMVVLGEDFEGRKEVGMVPLWDTAPLAGADGGGDSGGDLALEEGMGGGSAGGDATAEVQDSSMTDGRVLPQSEAV